MNFEINESDEQLQETIRSCLLAFSGIDIIVLLFQGHQRPFAFALQGKEDLKPNSSHLCLPEYNYLVPKILLCSIPSTMI